MQYDELNSTYMPIQQNRSGSSFVAIIQRIAALIWSWLNRSRDRHALKQLDDRLLDDIGITRRQALAEADKPFWKN